MRKRGGGEMGVQKNRERGKGKEKRGGWVGMIAGRGGKRGRRGGLNGGGKGGGRGGKRDGRRDENAKK